MDMDALLEQLQTTAFALHKAKALLVFMGDWFDQVEPVASRYHECGVINEIITDIVREQADKAQAIYDKLELGGFMLIKWENMDKGAG